MTRLRVAGVALALFGFGALAGRMTVPAKVVSVDRFVQVQKDAVAQVAAAKAETHAAAKTNTRWLTRTEYLPGGTVTVTRTVVKEVDRKADTATASTVATEETHEAARSEVHERIVETAKPNWSVAARAGLGLDLKPRYQGELGRRLFGGLWLTAGADITQRVALVGLRLEF